MKLVLAVVLSLCVSYAAAECDVLSRFKVKHQWGEAFGVGHRRLEFAVKIFARLFKDHPETVALFSRVHSDNILSPEFEAHAERVVGGIDTCIGLLDDPAALTAHLAHLKGQHDGRNVKPEFYAFLSQEIISLLPEKLGTRVDIDAWKGCLSVITDGIKG